MHHVDHTDKSAFPPRFVSGVVCNWGNIRRIKLATQQLGSHLTAGHPYFTANIPHQQLTTMMSSVDDNHCPLAADGPNVTLTMRLLMQGKVSYPGPFCQPFLLCYGTSLLKSVSISDFAFCDRIVVKTFADWISQGSLHNLEGLCLFLYSPTNLSLLYQWQFILL